MWRKNHLKSIRKEKDEEYALGKKLVVTSLKDIQLHLKVIVLFTTSFMIWFLFLLVFSPKRVSNPIRVFLSTPPAECKDNFSVYIYNLPSKYNFDLLRDCTSLNIYTDMCPHVTNNGLGSPLPQMGSSWFTTHQLIAELIIHARIQNHPCLTEDAHKSTLFYVPFYGGLHASSKFREPNYTTRDALAVELVEYIQEQKWWKRNSGKDHFMAFGRTAWDFMRSDEVADFGANKLLNMSPVKNNMSVLVVERHPWEGHNQYGIPYPSYFHPSTSSEMVEWQNNMSYIDRIHLFSFVGAPRTGKKKVVTRDKVIKQCEESSKCLILKCGHGPSKCHNPREVVKVMMTSNFCLQVLGDSYTRRSTFDSMLAGCIPVFFSNHTAYSQYKWFLPSDPTTYSVYIDLERNHSIRIEEELLKIPMDEVERKRRTVIELIPTFTYAHPNSTSYGFKDVVDVALKALSDHVTSLLRSPTLLDLP